MRVPSMAVLAMLLAELSGCNGGETKVPLASASAPAGVNGLRGAGEFAGIEDRAARSRALFTEASRVLTHARCVNCHPNGDAPLMGMERSLHDPPAVRGPEGKGVVGMECSGCHQDRNQDLARVPGAPKWALAPIEMAWVGKAPRALCEQLKDKKRNGGKSLAEIAEHSAHDPLVAWGWSPGSGREPAPGSQAVFGGLIAAWVETGAECPTEDVPAGDAARKKERP